MTITRDSLPIQSLGYPAAEWDALIERWNVRPPDSRIEPPGGWGTLRVEIGAVWTVTAGVVSQDSAGTDWTTYRGLPTLIDDLRFGEPYGELDGSLRIPGLSIFDDLTGLPLAAVDIYRVLPPALAATYGVTEVPYWHGFVSSIETAHGPGQEPGVSLQLMGALFGEISLRAHQPIMVNDAQDVGTWLGRALDPQAYSRPLTPFHFQFDSDTTGIELRHRGSRGQMVVDYCDEVLALAQEGSSQWTIARAFDTDGFPLARCYYLRAKSNELAGAVQQNTVVVGGYGVSVSLSVDPSEVPTTIYGEGLAPTSVPWMNGARWRNAVFPMLTTDPPAYPGPLALTDTGDDVIALQGQLRAGGWPDVQITGTFDADTVTALNALYEDQGHDETGEIETEDDWNLVWSSGTGTTDLASGWFKPLSSLPSVEKYLYAADGDTNGANPDYDPAAIKVDRAISFGDGIAKSRARKYAKRLVAQANDLLPVIGTVTLTSDPTNEAGQSRSRMDIVEGSWLRLGNVGESHRDVYVAGVQPAPQSYAAPVTLTVASASWDLLDLTTRIEARKEAADNPAKSFYAQRMRPQRPWKDSSGWDAESGAGLIRSFTHPGGEWVTQRVIAGGYAGTIQTIDLDAHTDTEFVFAFFALEPNLTTLAAMIPDPLVEEPDGYGWWNHPDNLAQLEEWGLIEAWGDHKNPGGYWPGSKPDELPLTGKLKDALGWGFYTDGGTSPFIYLVMWAAGACTPSGLARIQVNE